MPDRPCTVTRWRVDAQQRNAFMEVLSQLEVVLLGLPVPPGSLMLLQSTDDPTVLHTVGWFESRADLEAMRQHDEARRLFDELIALSSEFRPATHLLVRAAGHKMSRGRASGSHPGSDDSSADHAGTT